MLLIVNVIHSKLKVLDLLESVLHLECGGELQEMCTSMDTNEQVRDTCVQVCVHVCVRACVCVCELCVVGFTTNARYPASYSISI